MLNKVIFVLLISLGIQAGSFAQVENYQFHQLPKALGLSQHYINAIWQDQKGFLWFGTWLGLMRYDGYAVKVYKQETGGANGLFSNKITTIYEDKAGQLWIGTRRSGLYLFDEKLDKFINFGHDSENPKSLSNDIVYTIFEDDKGRFWVGTEKGLNLLDRENGTFQRFLNEPNHPNSISDNFISSICQSEDGTLWFGTRTGINRLIEGDNVQFKRYYFDTDGQTIFQAHQIKTTELAQEPFLSENFIYKIIPSDFQKNTIWIGTKSGLRKLVYNPKDWDDLYLKTYKKDNSTNSLSNNFVRDIYEYDGQLWIATQDGLNLLNLRTSTMTALSTHPDNRFSLTNNTIHSLHKDHTNILWIGTEKGINKLQLEANPFSTVQFNKDINSKSNIVSKMSASQSPNKAWIGTRGGGLNSLELNNGNATKQSYRFREVGSMQLSNVITDIYEDQNNQLWLTTNGAGLIKLQTKQIPKEGGLLNNFTQIVEKKGRQNISDNYLMCLSPAQNDDIWIGSWQEGINRYEKSSDTFSKYSATLDGKLDLTSFPVVVLLERKQHGKIQLWVGTRGNGIYLLAFLPEKNGFTLLHHFSEKNEKYTLSNNFISEIYEDDNNRLWVATENGLNLWNEKNQLFDALPNLPSLSNSVIHSLQSDKNGRLWCGTKDELIVITPLPNRQFEVKRVNTVSSDDEQFTYSTLLRLDNEHLLSGGLKGVTYFHPNDIKTDTIAPKVAFVDFRLYNKSVGIGEKVHRRIILPESIHTLSKITLLHTENNFAFQFAALHYVHPEKNQFRFKLEGYDKDWIYTDADHRIASYTNLPYRSYVLSVQVANYDGVWSEAEASIQIVVKPPFWLTNWAIFIYVLLLIGVLLLLRQITIVRANLKNKIELERVKREKLEEVNHLKTQFFTNISHELRTPLTLIVSPLEELIRNSLDDKNRHRTYQRMYKNANRLLTMINQLLDIRKSEAGLLQLQVSEQDLVAFVNEATLSFNGWANSRHIDLSFESQLHELKMWFDPLQMEKVVFNLFSNALKFTPEGGQVQVTIDLDKHENAVLSIKDTGHGIAQEHLEQVFDRFYQVDHSPQTAQGTGIGLALCKNIVEKHGGNIRVNSEIGAGSTFIVTLKKGNQHFSKKEIVAISASTPDFSNIKTVATNKTAKAKTPKANIEKESLLLVEDNTDIRMYLSDHFQNQYHIEEAANGKIALEKALKNPPALIISDISMPEMNGIEFCNQIKKNVVTSHIPVILLTARTSLLYKIDGLETGADDYITKPFNINLLTKRVDNLIQNRKLLQEKFSANTFDFSPTKVVVNSLDEAFLTKVKTTIEANIDNTDFSVEVLSKALLLSNVKFYRKLKALTGQTPIQLIRKMRLQRAAQLLKTGNYSVSEVTYIVGFQDLRYFRQKFKEEFGVNPSIYKK